MLVDQHIKRTHFQTFWFVCSSDMHPNLCSSTHILLFQIFWISFRLLVTQYILVEMLVFWYANYSNCNNSVIAGDLQLIFINFLVNYLLKWKAQRQTKISCHSWNLYEGFAKFKQSEAFTGITITTFITKYSYVKNYNWMRFKIFI